MADVASSTSNVVLSASHPWSNISPSGPAMPVRRACFPSMLSKLW